MLIQVAQRISSIRNKFDMWYPFILAVVLLNKGVDSASASNNEGPHFMTEAKSSPTDVNKTDSCQSAFYPCSNYILGNSVLIAYYGITLGYGAKLISDGAEGLLDLGVAPALIGGVILPVSGVVPDSMMILVSGLGDRETAQKQISVGMGTLAGSTVLLLTVAWGASLVVGRVDLVTSPTCHGLMANSENKCTGYSLTKQGVEVSKEVTMTAVIMLITTLPYFIIQSSDWYFGATLVHVQGGQPAYVRVAALVTMLLAFTSFCVYIGMQFFMAHRGTNTPPMVKHQKHKEEQIMFRVGVTIEKVSVDLLPFNIEEKFVMEQQETKQAASDSSQVNILNI